MAALVLSWLAVAFLFALGAHLGVRGDEAVDVDVTVILGTTGALALGSGVNYAYGLELWEPHGLSLLAGAVGATVGVGAGVLGQRGAASTSRT